MLDEFTDERFLQSHTMGFKLPYGDPKAPYLEIDFQVKAPTGETFFITAMDDEHDDQGVYRTVEAEVNWMRLADIRRPGSTKLEALTPIQGLNAILFGTGWVVGAITPDTTVFTFEAQDASVLDMIWQWSKVTGNEILFESGMKKVSMLEQVGRFTALSFRHTRNMQEIKRRMTPPQCTRMYLFGRNDSDVKDENAGIPFIENYTYYTAQGMSLEDAKLNYRKDQIYSDASFTDMPALFAAGTARLAILSQPSIVYSAKVIDLNSVMGVEDYSLRVGDYVRVYDEELDIDVSSRVTRLIRYPYEPERNSIELSFNVLETDPRVLSERSDKSLEWELFTARTKLIEHITAGHRIMGRIRLTTIEGAEWVMGYSLTGIPATSGTIVIQAINDENSELIWPQQTLAVTAGVPFRYSWTFGQKEIPVGEYTFVVRAWTSGVEFNVDPFGSAFWILARGSTRSSVTLPNSIRFDYTGGVQSWTIPDDVTELQIEANGASGGTASQSGYGGQVTAMFPATAGNQLDIIVGGHGLVFSGGYPNGGNAGACNGTVAGFGYGGGGSSSVYSQGFSIVDAWIVAAGGGGHNALGASRNGTNAKGGDGGYEAGAAGLDTPSGLLTGGGGAAWNAGGVGGTGVSNGFAGQFALGGVGSLVYNTVGDFTSGGGGGGWYGGGGGPKTALVGGGWYGADGGGGSGHMGINGYDIENVDGSNLGHGYVIISWELPDEE